MPHRSSRPNRRPLLTLLAWALCALAAPGAASAEETRGLNVQGGRTMCYSEASARDLAMTKASNAAHEACRALGSGWRVRSMGNQSAQCSPCADGKQWRCEVPRLMVTCFNNRGEYADPKPEKPAPVPAETEEADETEEPSGAAAPAAAAGATSSSSSGASSAGSSTRRTAPASSTPSRPPPSSSAPARSSSSTPRAAAPSAAQAAAARRQQEQAAAARRMAESVEQSRRDMAETQQKFNQSLESWSAAQDQAREEFYSEAAVEARKQARQRHFDAWDRALQKTQRRRHAAENAYHREPTARNAAAVARAYASYDWSRDSIDHCGAAKWYARAADKNAGYDGEARRWRLRCSRQTDDWQRPTLQFMTNGHPFRWMWSAGAGLTTGAWTGIGGSFHANLLGSLNVDLLFANTVRVPGDPFIGVGGRAHAAWPLGMPWWPVSVGPAAQVTFFGSDLSEDNGVEQAYFASVGFRGDYRPCLEKRWGNGFYVSVYVPTKQADWQYDTTTVSLGWQYCNNKGDTFD